MNKLHESKSVSGRVTTASCGVLCLLVGLVWALGLRAQTPAEHASHHPGAASAEAMPAAPGAVPAVGATPAPGGMGGMMEGMGEMMKGMHGTPPPKELYPTLMALPELSPEQRTLVEQQAAERMHAGTMLLGQALDTLNAGAQSGDYAAMHEAITRLHEGAAQLESGIAARRALAEGRAPRTVALAWFKQEMNLPLATTPVAHQRVTPFHLFTMVLLVMFALAMVAVYFLKMRRAAALFGRIEADKGSPPPGSAPELAGGKPPGGDKQADGDKPPARDKPPSEGKPPSGDTPAPADKPVAPADKPAAADKPSSGDKPASGDRPPSAGAVTADKLATAADKLTAVAEKLAAAAETPVGDKSATEGKTPSPAADSKATPQELLAATKFTCLAPAAREVFLVGSFNGWDAKATPMTKDTKGNWDATMPLPLGRHEFKFVVDGVLCCEPGCEGTNHACPKCVTTSSGSMNRFIEVPSI